MNTDLPIVSVISRSPCFRDGTPEHSFRRLLMYLKRRFCLGGLLSVSRWSSLSMEIRLSITSQYAFLIALWWSCFSLRAKARNLGSWPFLRAFLLALSRRLPSRMSLVVTHGRRMLSLMVLVGVCSLMASHNLSLNRVQMESMDETVLTFSRISWCIAFSAALILSQVALF